MSLIEIDHNVFKRLLLYTRSLEDGVFDEEGLKGIRELRNKFDDGKNVDEKIDDFVEFSKQKHKTDSSPAMTFEEFLNSPIPVKKSDKGGNRNQRS